MTFSLKLPNMVAFKAYAIDLMERVAATFAESALAGITLGVATGSGFWQTALVTAAFALVKGLLAYFVPSIGNLKTAGMLSWIISAIVKSPNTSVTVTTPAVVAQAAIPIVTTVIQDVQQDISTPPTPDQAVAQVEQGVMDIVKKVSGADQ